MSYPTADAIKGIQSVSNTAVPVIAYIVMSMTQTHKHATTVTVFCIRPSNLTLTVALATVLKELQLAGSVTAHCSWITVYSLQSTDYRLQQPLVAFVLELESKKSSP